MNTSEIKLNNITKLNFHKFKNINLFDYQIKTIQQLLEHERGLLNLNLNNLQVRNLLAHFSQINGRNSIYDLTNKEMRKRFFSKNIFSLNHNIGILSNKVGSGKTFIILGLIMSRLKYNQHKVFNQYNTNIIYQNSSFDKDISSLISQYLLEDYDFYFNTNSDLLNEYKNIFLSDNKNLMMVDNEDFKTINNIIVVPHNLFEQWKSEITQYTNFNCIFIKDKKNLNQSFDDSDLILCNVNQLKKFLNIIHNKYKISRLFIDEADTINLGNFPEINSDFLWLITTTYKRLLKPKNHGFIRNIFNSTNNKNIYGNEIYYLLLEKLTYTFNSKYIDNKVNLKTPNKNYIIVKNNFINKLFYNLKKNNFFLYLNSYDYSNLFYYIIKSNNSSSFALLYQIKYILSSYSNDYSNTFSDNYINYDIADNINYENTSSILFVYLIKNIYKIKLYISDFMRIFNDTKYFLREYKNHFTFCNICSYNCNFEYISNLNIKNSYHKELYKNNCKLLNPIYNNYKITETSCHNYYKKILKIVNEITYIKKQLYNYKYCPKCLSQHNNSNKCSDNFFKSIFDIFNINFLEYNFFNIFLDNFNSNKYNFIQKIDTQIFNNVNDVSISNYNLKINNMIKYLKNDIKSKKRCLLFSDNYNFFDNIIKQLQQNNIKYRVLKGNTNTINSILKKYKNHDIDILLMNMKFSGSGINLQMSDNIYIMNMIDSNTETQVIGRINRINKKDNFDIYYFFSDDEYNLYKNNNKNNNINNEKIIIEEI